MSKILTYDCLLVKEYEQLYQQCGFILLIKDCYKYLIVQAKKKKKVQKFSNWRAIRKENKIGQSCEIAYL